MMEGLKSGELPEPSISILQAVLNNAASSGLAVGRAFRWRFYRKPVNHFPFKSQQRKFLFGKLQEP